MVSDVLNEMKTGSRIEIAPNAGRASIYTRIIGGWGAYNAPQTSLNCAFSIQTDSGKGIVMYHLFLQFNYSLNQLNFNCIFVKYFYLLVSLHIPQLYCSFVHVIFPELLSIFRLISTEA